jgi:archaellum component FlaC
MHLLQYQTKMNCFKHSHATQEEREINRMKARVESLEKEINLLQQRLDNLKQEYDTKAENEYRQEIQTCKEQIRTLMEANDKLTITIEILQRLWLK